MSEANGRYNTISFRYRFELVEETSQVVEHLAAILEIDGRRFCDHVDLVELVHSASKTGEFEIYTCSCGHAPCSDIPAVRVEQSGASIVWWVHESLFDPESRIAADSPAARWQRYEFARSLYETEIAEAVAFAQERWRVSHVAVEVLPFRPGNDMLLHPRLERVGGASANG